MILDDLIAILDWIDEHEPSGADVIQELSILGPRLREFVDAYHREHDHLPQG